MRPYVVSLTVLMTVEADSPEEAVARAGTGRAVGVEWSAEDESEYAARITQEYYRDKE